MKTHFQWVLVAIGLLAACAVNPRPQIAMGTIGGGCYSDVDCVSGLFCDTTAPGGQCLKKCSTTADCGQGSVCGAENRCYQACQKNDDCKRYGYTCKGNAPKMFCDAAGARRGELSF